MILETGTALLSTLVGVHIYRSHTAHQDFIGDLTGAMYNVVRGKKEHVLWASRKAPNYIISKHPAEEAVDTRRFGTPMGRLESIATVIGPKKTQDFLKPDEPAMPPETVDPGWLAATDVDDDMFNGIDF